MANPSGLTPRSFRAPIGEGNAKRIIDAINAAFGGTRRTRKQFSLWNFEPTVVGALGSPTPETLAPFGQVWVDQGATITGIYLSGISDKETGSITFEVFKRLDAGEFVSLGTVELTGGEGDYAVASLVPTEGVASISESGETYLYAQLTDYAGPGGYGGLTLEVAIEF